MTSLFVSFSAIASTRAHCNRVLPTRMLPFHVGTVSCAPFGPLVSRVGSAESLFSRNIGPYARLYLRVPRWTHFLAMICPTLGASKHFEAFRLPQIRLFRFSNLPLCLLTTPLWRIPKIIFSSRAFRFLYKYLTELGVPFSLSPVLDFNHFLVRY
ncbi:hypothetical protein IW262DRAFT_911026 [Armillaria fumosa]|nr:hypothetical protein IW262DRAFT_911026 [Armillaria fumosa]